VTSVIGSDRDVVIAARLAAERAGYLVHVVEAPVVGEARRVGPAHVRHALELAEAACASGTCGRGVAVLSAGETTVRVVGHGCGGRNQEFVLAAAAILAEARHPAVFASVGTDGIDGPTDAAGAVADTDTTRRLGESGMVAEAILDRNDSYAAFAALGDLIKTGVTETNVGDLQVLLVQPAALRSSRQEGE
jgi:hydroxypyruvate reductase